MSLVERRIVTDAHGYREVALDYRIARAAMLDTDRWSEPAASDVLVSASQASPYGQFALPGTGEGSQSLV